MPLLAMSLWQKLAEDVKGKEAALEAAEQKRELEALLRALTPSRTRPRSARGIAEGARHPPEGAVQREMARRCSGAVFGRGGGRSCRRRTIFEDEVAPSMASSPRRPIKVSDKAKR